jgi:hypothetical protein
MNALDHVGRVLCILGLVFVLLVFWQRNRIKKFALARASRSTQPSLKQFWISTAAGAVVLALLPHFFESCTGLHLPLTIRVVATLAMLIMFAGWCVFGYFIILKHRSLTPQRSVRTGFVLVAISGIGFALALFFYHFGHP